MRMRQSANFFRVSYVVSGREGEDCYQIMGMWNSAYTKFLGYEIFAIDGCFVKVGTVNLQGAYIPYGSAEEKDGTRTICDPLLKEIVLYFRGMVEKGRSYPIQQVS